MNEMGDRVALLAVGIGGLSLKAPGAAAILTIFLAALAIRAAVIVWISLLVRKALLLVAIVFAPIALAGSSWDPTQIGRASCRDRVCKDVKLSVVARYLKKKKNTE